MSRDRAGDPAANGSLFNPATVIVVCAICLTFLGLTILFSASASFRQGPYFYLNKQLAGVVGATVLCLIASRLNLDYARRYAWWIGGAFLLLLLLVLVPHVGISVNGSRRWLGLDSARLQVSEFAKIGLVFCLAHFLACNQTRIGELKCGFLYPIGIVLAFVGLVAGEPDFGMASFFLVVGLMMLFLAGAKWRYLLIGASAAAVGLAVAVIHNPNRMRRLAEFWNAEPPYQVKQALAAYAAGGTVGTGLGQGRQQLSFLPEAHTDMIFAVIGEELGLWFTLLVVALFVTILVAGLIHLRRAPNLFHFLLVAGCLLFITLQATINLLSVTGMVPPKGMSLPFISAGLSNLLLMGLFVGVIVNTQRTWGRVALPERARAMREVLA
ncbi:MAG TPA: putative peptidoglycan glycosyltransferase FtsW [Opitutaceae bacterium]|nr:putative peptidoglycan glycosyltransferase FtsW [Opitutaceae bacterium]